jgi:hypothetical protein
MTSPLLIVIGKTTEAISRRWRCSGIEAIRGDFTSFLFARDQWPPRSAVLSLEFNTRVLLEDMTPPMLMHCINHSVNPTVRTSVRHELQRTPIGPLTE